MADKQLSAAEIAVNQQFVDPIKKWMRIKGLSRSEMMTNLCISEATLSKWLSGKQTMSVAQFNAVAALLGLKPHQVLSEAAMPESMDRLNAYQELAEIASSLDTSQVAALAVVGKAMKGPTK